MNIKNLLKGPWGTSAQKNEDPDPEEVRFAFEFVRSIERVADDMFSDPNNPYNNPEVARQNSEGIGRAIRDWAKRDPQVARVVEEFDREQLRA